MQPSKLTNPYHAAWIAGLRKGEAGEGQVLPFKTKESLMQARFALYNVKKSVKNKPLDFPQELVSAVELCMIGVIMKELKLVIRRKELHPAGDEIMQALGADMLAEIAPDAGKTQIEAEAEASAKRLEEMLNGQAPENPDAKARLAAYYTR